MLNPSYYPMGYYQNQIQPPQIQPQQPNQMQNGGFIVVKSIEEAKNYPTALGNVLTFKIENQPYVCEKSQGFSQFEAPQFNIYKLIKENADHVEKTYALQSDLEGLEKKISALESIVETLKGDNYDA